MERWTGRARHGEAGAVTGDSVRQNSTMRRAPSTHSSTPATSAMRTKPSPGFVPCAVRARKRPRQDRHIIVGVQTRGELGIRETGLGDVGPQIERGVGQTHVEHLGEHGRDGFELPQILRAIVANVRFILPRDHARFLKHRRKRRAMIGAIQQETFEDSGVASDEARAHAGHVRALRQARQHDETLETAIQLVRGFEAAERRVGFVEIDFRIALVGGNHEAVLVRQREEFAPVVEREHGACRIARRTHVEQLRARPDCFGHRRVIAREVARRVAIDEVRLGAREQRRAFVDLIERVRQSTMGGSPDAAA